MFDLSMALGIPPMQFEQMPEREFQRMAVYATSKGLPFERLEIMLAKVCAVVAASAGVKDAKPYDYMIKREIVPDVVTTDDIKQAFKFSPRNKRGRSR